MRSIETYSLEQKYWRGEKNPSKVNEKRNSACVAKSEGHSVSLSTQLKWNFSERQTRYVHCDRLLSWTRQLQKVCITWSTAPDLITLHHNIQSNDSSYAIWPRIHIAITSSPNWLMIEISQFSMRIRRRENTHSIYIYPQPQWSWILIVGPLSGIIHYALT